MYCVQQFNSMLCFPGGTENSATTKLRKQACVRGQEDDDENEDPDAKKARTEGLQKSFGACFDSMMPLQKSRQGADEMDDEKPKGKRKANSRQSNADNKAS